jgi:hypothetical protein
MATIIEQEAGWVRVRGNIRTVTVRRFTKSRGSSFSGWVAQCDDGANYSDPCDRAEAIRSAFRMADGTCGY